MVTRSILTAVFRYSSLAVALSLPLILTSGCGGSGDGHDDSLGGAQVENIDSQDRTLEVGEGTVVAADFNFNFAYVDDGGHVFVVVHLPAGLALREGTSEIEKNDDDRVGAEVTPCISGESYLVYDLNFDDLAGAQPPSRDAAARLKFTVDAISSNPGAIIEASADSDLPVFSCTRTFLSDAATAIDVD